MELYLAYSSSSAGGGWWSWTPFAAVVVGIPVLGPIVVCQMRKIRGPVVAGTAEVLSLRQFGSVAVNGPSRMICRLRLGVNVPGRDPYSVAVWRNIAPWDLGAFQKGSTVAVEVSETNPRKLRFVDPSHRFVVDWDAQRPLPETGLKSVRRGIYPSPGERDCSGYQLLS
jgi:hypothetical protein